MLLRVLTKHFSCFTAHILEPPALRLCGAYAYSATIRPENKQHRAMATYCGPLGLVGKDSCMPTFVRCFPRGHEAET